MSLHDFLYPNGRPATVSAGPSATEVIPVPCRAALCVQCDGGERRTLGTCADCEGRLVQVVVDDDDKRELSPSSPPSTDEERLGAALALAALTTRLMPRQLDEAQTLYFAMTRELPPHLRQKAGSAWNAAVREAELDAMRPQYRRWGGGRQ